MRVAVNNEDIECRCFADLEKMIRNDVKADIDNIWLAGGEEYPCLAILRKENFAVIHYFANGNGLMWQSVGNGDQDISFLSGADAVLMPANSVVSMDDAFACAKAFWSDLKLPECICWREL